MRFEELKELTFKEWDGEPIMCYVHKGLTNEIKPDSVEVVKIVSYNAEADHSWGVSCGSDVYRHVYPVRLNEGILRKSGIVRMTNRQLAMWLAKGNGQMSHLFKGQTFLPGKSSVVDHHTYCLKDDCQLCNDEIKVRKWDSEDWVEPTTDLL